jgi:flagellar basal body-associated protein FliL
MKPFDPSLRLNGWKEKRKEHEKEVKTMKISTKLAIMMVAAVLSLAGFGILATSLSADKIVADLTPTTSFSVSVTG